MRRNQSSGNEKEKTGVKTVTKSDLKFFSYLVTKVHLKAAIRFLLEFEYFL